MGRAPSARGWSPFPTPRIIRAVRSAQARGREFLLVHRLFRSDRTGDIIKPVFTRFAFPPRWHYDILRALDYFQAAGAPCDPRLAEAIEIVQSTQRSDGRWSLQNHWKGKTYFELERLGAPGRGVGGAESLLGQKQRNIGDTVVSGKSDRSRRVELPGGALIVI